MKRRAALRVAALGVLAPLAACSHRPEALPVVAHGRVERLAAFASRHVAPRHVDVWLPPDYDGRARHPVIYMHDGQALFDGAQAMSRSGWRVDAAVAGLVAQGLAPAPLIVGIWSHRAHRHSEYFPQPVLDRLSAGAREHLWARVPPLMRPVAEELLRDGRSRSEAYLRFVADELKPAIDARFATRPGRQDSFLMGSSMGSLISLHGLLSRPQVFGAAAALSTHWVGLFERNDTVSDAAVAWLRDVLPARRQDLRLYLDRGTVEMDAEYAHAQGQVDALLREHGLGPPRVVSRVFEGAGHNERDWAARLHVPLAFLLQTPGADPP